MAMSPDESQPPSRMQSMSPEECQPPRRTSKRKGKGRKKKLPWPRSQIKRIMQSDDYVGQVNQKVVEAMSAAMQGFTTHILDKAIDICREKDLRKIDEGVLKDVFNHDDKLDFLRELASTLKSTKRKKPSGKPGQDQIRQRHKPNGATSLLLSNQATSDEAVTTDASDEGFGDEGGSLEEEKYPREPVIMYPKIVLPKRISPPGRSANGPKEENANASKFPPAPAQVDGNHFQPSTEDFSVSDEERSPKRRRYRPSPSNNVKLEAEDEPPHATGRQPLPPARHTAPAYRQLGLSQTDDDGVEAPSRRPNRALTPGEGSEGEPPPTQVEPVGPEEPAPCQGEVARQSPPHLGPFDRK